jgi:hypothetical protein
MKIENHERLGTTVASKSLISVQPNNNELLSQNLTNEKTLNPNVQQVHLPKADLKPLSQSNFISQLNDFYRKLKNLENSLAVSLSRYKNRLFSQLHQNSQNVVTNAAQTNNQPNIFKTASIPELISRKDEISSKYLLGIDEIIENIKNFAKIFENLDKETKIYLANILDRVEKLKNKLSGEIYFSYNTTLYDIDFISKFFNKAKENKNFIIYKGNYVDELTTYFLCHIFNCGLVNFDLLEDQPHVDINLLIQNRLYLLSCDNMYLELFKKYVTSFTSAGMNLEVTLSRFFFDRFDYLNLYFQDIIVTRLLDRLLEFKDSSKGVLLTSINVLDPVRLHKTNEFLRRVSAQGIIDYGSFDVKFLGQENYPTIKKLFLIELPVELLQMFKYYLDYFIFEKLKKKSK